MESQKGKMKLYFAPDQDCETPLVEMLNGATKTITIADYSFSEPSVTTAILNAHSRGVSTTLLFDKTQAHEKVMQAELARLDDAGISYLLGESDKHRIMHLKVAVADNTIAFGSYNFTNAANLENNVLAIYTSKNDSVTFVAQIQKIIAFIQSSNKVNLERNPMNYKALVLRAVEVFVVAFVTFLAGSGLDVAHLPALNEVAKVALAGCVVAGDVVYQQVVKPLLQPVAAKLGL